MAIHNRKKEKTKTKLILLGGQIPIQEETVFSQEPFNFAIEINGMPVWLVAKPLRWSAGQFGILFNLFGRIADIYNKINGKELSSIIPEDIRMLSHLPLYLATILEFRDQDDYIIEIQNATDKRQISRYAKKRLFFERLKINDVLIPEHLKSLKNKPLLIRYLYCMFFGYRQINKMSIEQVKKISNDIEADQILDILSLLDYQKILVITRHVIDFNSGPLKKNIFLN
jgi:hypothetical protein